MFSQRKLLGCLLHALIFHVYGSIYGIAMTACVVVSTNYLSFCLSWFANANLAAFSCNLANLFSYLETFLRVGLMNLPFISLTLIVSSLICKSLRITSLCRKNISPSRLYHLSKYI